MGKKVNHGKISYECHLAFIDAMREAQTKEGLFTADDYFNKIIERGIDPRDAKASGGIQGALWKAYHSQGWIERTKESVVSKREGQRGALLRVWRVRALPKTEV